MKITVTNPISKHGDSLEDFKEKSFKGQKQKKLQGWSHRSTGLVKADGTNTKFLWIGGNAQVSKKMNDSYFCILQELDANLFPLAQDLNLD